ncbi:hypothetical protein D9756_010229 [Leucocoprinus leucothites]|uniref:Protein kinase domain-containing protein n=1 Tax=Leucocoprinus leucothites TaxID=201217 RepID=A0A8H5CUB3_9AGAR|nr:hypothetical protein D9756_010229 [Leucoagaricus leucothites]
MNPRGGMADEPSMEEIGHVEGKGATAPHDHSRVEKIDEAYFAYGDHADVYKGRLDGKKIVVIKQLRGVNSNKIGIRDDLRSRLQIEFSTNWQRLNHPNVCRVHLIVNDFGFLPALVLDYFPKGSLIKHIVKNTPPDEQRLRWVLEIAEGLAHLHSFEVYHGDLRCANVFLNGSNQAVIADYAIAQYFSNSDFTSAKSTGTVRWTGPEVISIPPDPNSSKEKLDIFAFGMTMLEIFSGEAPYNGKSDTGAIFAIAKGEPPKLPERMSNDDDLKMLFEACTCKNPGERPFANEISSFFSPYLSLCRPKAFFKESSSIWVLGFSKFVHDLPCSHDYMPPLKWDQPSAFNSLPARSAMAQAGYLFGSAKTLVSSATLDCYDNFPPAQLERYLHL